MRAYDKPQETSYQMRQRLAEIEQNQRRLMLALYELDNQETLRKKAVTLSSDHSHKTIEANKPM